MPQPPTEALRQRAARLQRLVRQNGTSYHVYGDVQGSHRPWDLELLPFLLPQEEWNHIRQGICQRMQVLEHVLRDVYGPQLLLQQGMLPAALVQGHPGYLRAMHGIAQPRYLHVAAFDLVRGTDGHWWLMGQRTQAPSGLGYLLENRHVVRQLFPRVFDRMQVHAITSGYRTLLDSLETQCAPLLQSGETATIVLLTPGEMNETWFEQAYLARYLGLPLVEGADLTVRQEKLYLRTMQGLQRVHGVLRRVDDTWLDPLELRPESTLGVPGLLQAMRAGQVVVANSPGSGFMESPALLGFLPPIARQVLGEDLVIPALPTWWCGEPAAFAAVQPELHSRVIKATYTGSELHQGFASLLGSQLGEQDLQALRARMQQQPQDFTVQAYMPLSQTPSWKESSRNDADCRLQMRPAVLRVFAIGHAQGWHVLPGGMARLAPPWQAIASMQHGGSSADVWVPGDRPGSTAPTPQPPLRKAVQPEPITSRMAENLFWLGRYTERCENTLQLAQLAVDCLSQQDRPDPPLLQWLYHSCIDQNLLPEAPQSPVPASPYDLEQALLASLRKTDNGIAATVLPMLRTASALRGQLPQQHWQIARQVDEALQQLQHAALRPSLADSATQLQQISNALAALTGVQIDRLAHDAGWQLLMLGRMVERLAYSTNILLHAHERQATRDSQAASALLTLFDARIPQPRLQTGAADDASLWQQLLGSMRHPRALGWTLQQAQHYLQYLPSLVTPAPMAPPAQMPETAHPAQQPPPWPDLSPWHAGTATTAMIAPTLQHCMHTAVWLNAAIAAAYFYPVADASHSVGA